MVQGTVALTADIIRFVSDQLELLVRRYLPQGRLPLRFAGFPTHPWTIGDLAETLSLLHELGVYQLQDRDIEEWLAELLAQVQPEDCNCFASYHLAESIGRFGAWQGNPLLEELKDDTRERLRRAIDSTDIVDREAESLPGLPRNYWAVLARCEVARERLGLLDDDSVLELAVGKCRAMIAENPQGFIDDSPGRLGRYDIYSAEICCFLEPLYERLPREHVDLLLEAHRRQLELGARDNGAYLVWGRSTGLISIAMTMELAALILAEERAEHPERMAGLIGHAFEAQQAWWRDGLVSAHRDRMTYGYRGPQRLLQMTLDFCGKLLAVAAKLRGLEQGASALPPERWRLSELDRLLPLDERHAAVWYYRHGVWDFQLPVVSGQTADYLPWPQQPGLLEVPVDSQLVAGLPLVQIDDRLWTVAGRPVDISKTPNILSLRYDRLRPIDDLEGGDSRPATASLVYRANGAGFTLQVDWRAEGLQRAAVAVPELPERPLRVHIDGVVWVQVPVDGLAPWRSFWGSFARVHEADVPVSRGRLSYHMRVQPATPTG